MTILQQSPSILTELRMSGKEHAMKVCSDVLLLKSPQKDLRMNGQPNMQQLSADERS